MDREPNPDLEVEGGHQEALVLVGEVGGWNLAEGIQEEVEVVAVLWQC